MARPYAKQAALACRLHRASQCRFELERAMAMVAALQPRAIVEIGCDCGGTLYAWTRLAPLVLGVTLADNSFAAGGQDAPLHAHGATVLVGDSHHPDSVAWVRGKLDRAADALVIDGDHSLPGVLADLANYGPMVRAGGLVLLHDVLPRDPQRSQVHEAWARVCAHGGFATSEFASKTGYGYGAISVSGAEPWHALA